MSMSLQSASEARRRLSEQMQRARGLLLALRAVVLAALAMALWAVVEPQDQIGQLVCGVAALLLGAVLSARRGTLHAVSPQDLALSLEIEFGTATTTALDSQHAAVALPPAWEQAVHSGLQAQKRLEQRRLLVLASTIVLPLLAALLALPNAAPSLNLAMSEVGRVVARLSRGATVLVIQGASTDLGKKPLPLSASRPLDLDLLAPNLIEIKVSGAMLSGLPPGVELRHPAKTAATPTPANTNASGTSAGTGPAPADAAGNVYQSFQMAPVDDGKGDVHAEAHEHAIAFAVAEDVDLFIPAIDAGKPLAHIHVRQLPVPKVKLELVAAAEDPWPDDQPLPLRIIVRAENPLQTVRLLIKSEQKVAKELVANVLADDKLELTSDYRLLLEPYVENDIAELEIVAEATDRALPTPLVGLSEPLKITTASAYGRYRQALQTLREMKTLIDTALTSPTVKLPKQAQALAQKAADQSEKSPFFDGLDRMQIHQFALRAGEIINQAQAEGLGELSQGLNDFLFEHEILDDRERDRDYFVAARALSRLVEQEPAKRPANLPVVAQRLRHFLDDRQERWVKRTARLKPGLVPSEWAEIQAKHSFQATIAKIEALDAKSSKAKQAQIQSEQLNLLSKSVVDYRAWIQDLEAAEDKMREQEDKQRQEGLASARDTLKELQKRQGEISTELDRSDERPREQMEAQWPATRMKQNANSKETHRLEGQMRALSPAAASRIQGAAKAMDQSNEAGTRSDFVQAESYADLAGRLLRQAESAAQQSQQRRRSRGRRRRVTGDNYYGQSVVGGDVEIKREYQVDRRYREDILDEVQSTNYDEDNRSLMENYLRHVVR